MTLVGSLASACKGVSSLAVQCSVSERAGLDLDVSKRSEDYFHQIERSGGPRWEY